MKTLFFLILLTASLGFFARTMFAMVRAAARGARDPRPRLDQIPARLLSVLIYFFGQKRVSEEGPGHMTSKHHLMIFWGFLIITIGTVEILIGGALPNFSLADILPAFIASPLKWTIDFVNLLVLTAISWAIFRRIAIQPRLIPMNLDAAIILGAIASLMITHFLYHGFESAAHFHKTGGTYEAFLPVSNLVAGWLVPVSPGAAHFGAEAAYWVHVVILLTFLNYLPYSKHIHLLGAMPNILTRNLSEQRLDMPRLDLEDETQWGVGRFEQFSWKSLLDTYACTECARCTNYCPAYNTDKNLSPMQLIHDIRYEMIDRDKLYVDIEEIKGQIETFGKADDEHKPPDLVHLESQLGELEQKLEEMPPMVGGRIQEDTLWACTTCGQCQEVCPVFIEHPLKIVQMRQNLVLEQEKVPAELARTFRNIERQSNPWGISDEKRMEWAEGLHVPTIEDHPKPEYILWIGCAGSFDSRIIKQTRAMVKVLNSAGVDYAVLGHSEKCTGDPARRGGNEFLFQMQAETNVETLNEVGATKVITSCPHCLHTLRHDYPQFGGNFEVVHHTTLIAQLIKDGHLTPGPGANGIREGKVTYHDSCYLGRWNREFDAPRDILASLPIRDGVIELKRNKRHGFCCGAGGARMFMEEDSPRMNANRTDEILESGAETVAVACPFCSIMLTDGMKERNRDEDIEVLDIAELVAQNIPDVPIGNLVRRKA